MSIEVSYLGVFLAALVYMIMGFLWYSPILFAKPWIKCMGYSEESLKSEQKKMGLYYFMSLILAIVTAYVLGYFISLSIHLSTASVSHWQTGLCVAMMAWGGFIMPVQASCTIFSLTKNWKLFAINTGYQLVGLLLMGIVLAVV